MLNSFSAGDEWTDFMNFNISRLTSSGASSCGQCPAFTLARIAEGYNAWIISAALGRIQGSCSPHKSNNGTFMILYYKIIFNSKVRNELFYPKYHINRWRNEWRGEYFDVILIRRSISL